MFVTKEKICVYYEMAKLNSKKTEKLWVYEEIFFVGLTPEWQIQFLA